MLMEGTINYECGDETFDLQAGDCICEDEAVQHTLSNPGKTTASVLVVYANDSPKCD